MEMLEHALFSARAGRFDIVDRRDLDTIRTEHRFQYSGDVDDNTAVSLGRHAGASVVILGSVSGTGAMRMLRVRAIDVETGRITGSALELM
jgi:curli biogenesis system outer membrane secretion channel CsgG